MDSILGKACPWSCYDRSKMAKEIMLPKGKVEVLAERILTSYNQKIR